ncbi:MAG: TAXI family TRAP transporter solute-binding subunit [Rhodobacter sp.]|nr:TAXI family TRAP transporter solute-binding subunit [Rhodobacter sp.]
MKTWTKLALAGALAASPAVADELKMATIAPGTSAYLVMSTMATIVNQEQDAHNITVDATGAATKHIIDMAKGNLDMVMTSPTVYFLMKNKKAMYQKLDAAPELAKNARLMFWFPYGQYHVLSYAEDGMTSLEDLRGKTVFLGPPGGGAWNAAKGWVEAQTGMVPGDDYENFKASWSSALQAFQDRQVDVYINGGIAPFPQVEQLAATSELRILGPTCAEFEAQDEAMKKPTQGLGREVGVIPAGVYGENVVNSEDVCTLGAVVGVTVRADMDADTVYEVTRAFWEGAEKMRDSAPWLADVTLAYAVRDGGMHLHEGAQRYYDEIGLTIPEGSMASAM